MLERAAPCSVRTGSLRLMHRGALLLVALLAASCGGGEPRSAPPAPELIAGAIAAMRAVPSASFEMTRAGAIITVEGFIFDKAIGRYAAPDAAEAVLRMKTPGPGGGEEGGLAIELGTIAVGDRTWLFNPLANRWDELSGGFNPAVLFDPAEGWTALLTDLTDVTLVAAGERTHELTGTVPAGRIDSLTAGLAGAQEVPLRMWLDAATLQIVRLEFSTVGDQGRSDWVITMSGFGAPVEIEPPVQE
jgi:hypothetical protein